MSTPTHTYLTDSRTGVIYEQRAAFDGFVWAQRLDDGTLDTFASGYLVAYEPRPSVGEIWKANDTGADVIIIAKNRVLGGWWVLPQPDGDLPADGTLPKALAYRNRDLSPKIRRARRRDEVVVPTPEAVTPPA